MLRESRSIFGRFPAVLRGLSADCRSILGRAPKSLGRRSVDSRPCSEISRPRIGRVSAVLRELSSGNRSTVGREFSAEILLADYRPRVIRYDCNAAASNCSAGSRWGTPDGRLNNLTAMTASHAAISCTFDIRPRSVGRHTAKEARRHIPKGSAGAFLKGSPGTSSDRKGPAGTLQNKGRGCAAGIRVGPGHAD